ncbi:hypothetical protein FRC16_007825 [Serendipita sp. 398]|nr:hypothetical protein FRC16_007825 [Serendipita sp. 398]
MDKDDDNIDAPGKGVQLGELDQPTSILDALSRVRKAIAGSRAKNRDLTLQWLDWATREHEKSLPTARQTRSRDESGQKKNATTETNPTKGSSVPEASSEKILGELLTIKRKVDELLCFQKSHQNLPPSSPTSTSASTLLPTPPTPTSYASAVRTGASVAQWRREVVAQLPEMNRKELEDFERLSPAALKRRVDDAILTSSKEEVRKAGIQGVRKSGKKRVVITAHSEEDAEILLRSADDWMARAFTGAAPAKQVCQVMVHFVPTSFTPGEKESTLELCSANRNLNLDPNQISGSRWVRKIDGLNKSKSSMILTVTDANLADRMIDKGLSILGSSCRVEKLWPDPVQCFKCQRYGHQARACKEQEPTCARCAGKHPTGSKLCARKCGSSTCADMRKCTHIVATCSNCGGTHRAMDKGCPERQKAEEALALSPHYSSPYFSSRRHPNTHQATHQAHSLALSHL